MTVFFTVFLHGVWLLLLWSGRSNHIFASNHNISDRLMWNRCFLHCSHSISSFTLSETHDSYNKQGLKGFHYLYGNSTIEFEEKDWVFIGGNFD